MGSATTTTCSEATEPEECECTGSGDFVDVGAFTEEHVSGCVLAAEFGVEDEEAKSVAAHAGGCPGELANPDRVVADTCDGEAWRAEYYGALFPLNPGGIVPAGPDLCTLVDSSEALP